MRNQTLYSLSYKTIWSREITKRRDVGLNFAIALKFDRRIDSTLPVPLSNFRAILTCRLAASTVQYFTRSYHKYSLLMNGIKTRSNKAPHGLVNRGAGGRFKNTYELLNQRALKFSYVNKIHIFPCMGKIFCVEFQRYPLKFHTKYLTHTLKDMIFMQFWNFKSS